MNHDNDAQPPVDYALLSAQIRYWLAFERTLPPGRISRFDADGNEVLDARIELTT